jgi:membrane complex biogenesis BtpA family protein
VTSDRTLLIGVVHLLPFPGSPRRSPGLDAFEAGPVAPATVAAMTLAARAVRQAAPGLRLGVNVLRNDARAAVGIAAAVGAAFVRINVHVGAMVTDQGVIEGRARDTLLERARLAADVRIVADVLVKHAVPLGPWSLEDAARDTAHRGLADVLVVTGSGTGRPTDPSHLARVRAAVPDVPVWVGSGLDPDGVAAMGPLDGAIVGTWLHRDADLDAPLDVARVRAMVEALRCSGGR